MKDILNENNIPIDELDPDVLGGDFEIPEDLSEYEENTNVSMAIAAMSIGGGLSIVDDFTTINYTNRYNPKKYIVIHYTAGKADNGSAAKANINYFKSINRSASANYFVDMNPIIYRCVDDDLVAWHCGTYGTYYHKYCRNSNSIGIEICSYMENGVYKFKEQTVKNAIALTKYLANKYNIPRENIIMHWHVTHKICAAPFMTNGKPNQRWENFLDAVFSDDNQGELEVVEFNKTGKVIDLGNDTLNFRSGPGTNYSIIGSFKSGDILNITGENGVWYYIDNKGFVHSNYVEIITNQYDDIRNSLFDNKIITDKNSWSKYDETITKGLAIQLLSNAIGDNINKQYKNNSHWSSKALNNLITKKVITDPSQWENTLEEYVSKDLYIALICNSLGGISDIYKNRVTDHWARNCLDTLCDKGVISDPKQWTDFEGLVRKDIAMDLVYKTWNKYFK